MNGISLLGNQSIIKKIIITHYRVLSALRHSLGLKINFSSRAAKDFNHFFCFIYLSVHLKLINLLELEIKKFCFINNMFQKSD
ncbi:hypothetical protein BpHYR1_042511 [Brachionus plicatilis]|uniref:Uncharacterized protein n=1 Tax=Brachionus plicatilis TaxID=10195 RepID=A0A3M7SXP8_BRAPC|nr:hypothetical protein BpHYR1_042511 [Brachionus plicatilis]